MTITRRAFHRGAAALAGSPRSASRNQSMRNAPTG